MQYSILEHGDQNEKDSWSLFLKKSFPSYEIFWGNFIVPLTGRSENILDLNFKNDPLLKVAYPGESDLLIHERLGIAQLAYSTLCFLLNAHLSITESDKKFINVVQVLSNLYSALDISAELFGRYERFQSGGQILVDIFDPGSIDEGMQMRKVFQKQNKYPPDVKGVREYRNVIVHGRQMIQALTPEARFIYIPRLGREKEFFDWRKGMAYFRSGHTCPFVHSKDLTKEAFDLVINYLETMWKQKLV